MNYIEPLYRSLFSQTSGYVLCWPFGRTIRIGDFFAIRPGTIDVIGNIYESYFQLNIKDTFAQDIYKFSSPVLEPFITKNTLWETFTPAKSLWRLSDECITDYESKQFLKPHKHKLLPAEVNKYSVGFKNEGSFFFQASDVTYVRMPHFREINKEIIRRLTTEFFNFNKIFLITEVAMVKDYSVGISRMEGAELVVSVDEYIDGSIVDLMASDKSFQVEKVKGLDYLKVRKEGGAIAFKAKKMDLSLKARDTLIRELYRSSEKEFQKYAVELMDNELFHLFPKIEINPGNANEFFEWTELTLEDVELFLSK